jgi:hypothetical protein
MPCAACAGAAPPQLCANALIAEKAPAATRKQAIDTQAAILAALRKRNGEKVVCEGTRQRSTLALARLRLFPRALADYLQRSEQRQKQQSGIQYLVGPAHIDRYITGGH